MNSRAYLFVLLLLSSTMLIAQSDYRPGYIIEKSGDTIFGEINYRGDLLMSKVCSFKFDDDNIQKYYPKDILAFRFIDSKYYISREIDDKAVFLEYLIKGEVNIYYLRDETKDHYYLDKENVRLTEIPYAKEIRYMVDEQSLSETQYMYESTKHIGLLSVYMQDAPDFKGRISRIKKPGHQNLIKLAKDYHNLTCEGESCIIYEKQPSLLKVNVEVLGGVIHFNKPTNILDKSYFRSGVMLNLWLPRTNEKLYLRTGVLYSQLEDIEDGKYNYLRFPVHLGYLAPSTYRVRPSASISLLSPTYSGGILIKINKRINVGVQAWVDFRYNKIPWIPSELFSYSVLGNVYIEL